MHVRIKIYREFYHSTDALIFWTLTHSEYFMALNSKQMRNNIAMQVKYK